MSQPIWVAMGTRPPGKDNRLGPIYANMVMMCRNAELETYNHPSQASGRIVAEVKGVEFNK